MILEHIILHLVVLSLLCGHAYGQDNRIDFYNQIKNYDLSIILTADSILTEDKEDSKDKIKRSEALGFIGDNFQRFYIHFTSIIQNPTNSYEYLAYGKTMVKENVCPFQGKIVIKESSIYKNGDIPTYKQGFAICEVVLYEDGKQSSTGLIRGKLTTNFVIDQKGKFRYDALMFVADGFSNNQFRGTWTSYKTNISKKCNWGDYRIPDSKGLDIGAGEFMVNEKYIMNGWISYMLDNMAPNLSIQRQKNTYQTKDWWR
jgi:hypothetical protein